ncbi:COP9 subunit 3, putative [Trichophyton verrucosum HKI 0517]|uniref:COP9 signalosome complex subunit 3 n=1 Tax=Trichophyton verrucosum (strain HKI 0517) TaxID=663202 RepID=D4D7H1_TRIVH|nr:COP9 subunit 3, putative [Trichophyton verrucosum HKI 0517]EFE42211.1 COP9 subunit 3, putative [Trichophyton verrucosum HKI 0517]
MATQLLLSFPPSAEVSDAEYDKTIRSFCVSVKKLSLGALVGSNTSGQGNHLEILDPAIHSVAYLHVLLACHQISQKSDKSSFQPGGESWEKALIFFEEFDPVQVRYAGREFTKLVEIIAVIASTPQKSLLAIQPLKNALLRLDPSGSTLTATHTLFVRTCLKANACRAALPVLERPIFHIPTSVDRTYHKRAQILPCVKDQSSSTFITDSSGLAGKITHQTYLEYYLYGAMIYMIRKEWDDALRFLHIVIAAPVTNTVSKIMVEAYKKWILVRLLAKGQVSALPRGIPPFAVKIYKSLSRPYEALADIFRDGSLQRLEAEMSVGIDLWDRQDGNAHLVYQLSAAYRRFSILKLEKAFSAIAIPEIANRVSYECSSAQELEEDIASLIADGQLNARLVQAADPSGPSILRFGKDNAGMDLSAEAQLSASLIKEKNRIKAMIDNVARIDVRLELGEDYMEGLVKAQRRAGAKNRNATTFDEDIMATSH